MIQFPSEDDSNAKSFYQDTQQISSRYSHKGFSFPRLKYSVFSNKQKKIVYKTIPEIFIYSISTNKMCCQ
jgi:hypothetical protein